MADNFDVEHEAKQNRERETLRARARTTQSTPSAADRERNRAEELKLPSHQQTPFGSRSAGLQLFPKPQTAQPGLGRVRQPNPRSIEFPLDEALSKRALTAAAWKSKRWAMRGRWQSQGRTSECVRWSISHLHMITPVIRQNAFDILKDLYTWAQQNDPWPGQEPTYYGTSVDAGLRYAKNIAKTISEYRWARNMDEVLGRLSSSTKDGGGPGMLGTDFYSGMANEDGSGVWHPTGELWGGHAYLAIGHEAPTAKKGRMILLGNSHDGNFTAKMPADEFEWLVFAQGGEFAAVTELPR